MQIASNLLTMIPSLFFKDALTLSPIFKVPTPLGVPVQI